MELQLPEDGKSLTKYVAHRLPCNVHVDGPAPTARAFCPFPDPIPSFRGRKLQPGNLDIPESSQLIFVERQPADDPDQALDRFSVKCTLDQKGFFYQHDDFPDDNSAVPRALNWLAVSAALHAPVDMSTTKESPDTSGSKCSAS